MSKGVLECVLACWRLKRKLRYYPAHVIILYIKEVYALKVYLARIWCYSLSYLTIYVGRWSVFFFPGGSWWDFWKCGIKTLICQHDKYVVNFMVCLRGVEGVNLFTIFSFDMGSIGSKINVRRKFETVTNTIY